MDSWNSYPSIFTIGHRAVKDILGGVVNVEEKVDGSQFSFGVDSNGEIYIRSKGAVQNLQAPEKMFNKAVETVKALAPRLHRGWTYRAEYLAKAKHNTLPYSRVPEQHLIIFDIATGLDTYLSYPDKHYEAQALGLEVVPLLASRIIQDEFELRKFLECESILGGVKIEGIVIKPVAMDIFGVDKKPLIAKFVSEAFKEAHKVTWGESNPKSGDILDKLGAAYKSPARWAKAVQHLKESGRLEGSPKDIGALINEVKKDIGQECEEEIKRALWKWAWPHVERKSTNGLAEWYKELLIKEAFEPAPEPFTPEEAAAFDRDLEKF